MHVTISWDISASDNRWSEINDMMKAKLKGYSWVKPLKSVYVVKVDSLEDRIELKDALNDVIKSVDEKIHLLITPAMEGGTYAGWLPKGLWEKINLRTK
ncbi:MULTISPECIES: hypothetical protein [Burkholderia]|uniref:hypothetical protein n=1 Tax=Burkholderia TaxID=32008 RepID=UPI00158A884C|nr:hypothetical protein [Burkholderia ambifaria]